jgi:hypothetical protein
LSELLKLYVEEYELLEMSLDKFYYFIHFSKTQLNAALISCSCCELNHNQNLSHWHSNWWNIAQCPLPRLIIIVGPALQLPRHNTSCVWNTQGTNCRTN